MSAKILYRVESNDYGNLWAAETGGYFSVGNRDADFPTDTDAREAAIEYARIVGSNGMRTRVVRTTEETVFDSKAKAEQ